MKDKMPSLTLNRVEENLTPDDLEQIKNIALNINSVSSETIETITNVLPALVQKNHNLNRIWRNDDGKIIGYLICENGGLHGDDKEKVVHLKYFGTNGEIGENLFKLIGEFIEDAKNSHYDKAVMLGWDKRLNNILERFGFKKNQKENISGLSTDYYELNLNQEELNDDDRERIVIDEIKEKHLQQILDKIEEHLEVYGKKGNRLEMEQISDIVEKKILENENPLILDDIQKAILNLKLLRYLQNNNSENLDINTLVDALIQTPEFISKEKGSLRKLFEIHYEKEKQIISSMRKISQIKASFYSLLEVDVINGKINNDIVDLFDKYSDAEYENNLLIFKKLKQYFKDENIPLTDKKATFFRIEEEYEIEIIPRLDLYENLFETESGDYHLSVLRSKKHLERESERMNHCVGTSNSYINKIKRREIEILSFRDKKGDPIITIEYNLKTGNIEQMKKESDEYLNFDDPYYEEFIQALEKMQDTYVYDYNSVTRKVVRRQRRKINVVNTSELEDLNLAKDFIATGRGNISIYDFDNEKDFVLKMGEVSREVPDELFAAVMNKKNGTDYEVEEIARTAEDIGEETRYFVGDLDRTHVEILNNRKNPLDIEGHLDFEYCTSLTSIPENVIIRGDANFTGCTSLTSIPKHINFGGYAYFNNCTSLIAISGDIIFGGNVYFRSCISLTSISGNIDFGGGAYFISCTSLVSISENISFGEDVHFEHCTSLTGEKREMLKKMKRDGKIAGNVFL